jgi:hypothetical protein
LDGVGQQVRGADEEIVEYLRGQGGLFARLWAGDWAGFPVKADGIEPDWSSLDAAFCCAVAAVTKQEEQIDRLYRASPLMRDKWDKREDYRRRTIDSAIDRVDDDRGFAGWRLRRAEERVHAMLEVEKRNGDGAVAASKEEGAQKVQGAADEAAQAGPRAAPEGDQGDAKRHADDPVAARLERLFPGDKVKRPEVNLLRWSELRRRAAAGPPEYVIDELLAFGDVQMVHSLPWGGKSTILSWAVGCVGQGVPFFGHPTRRCPVVYVNTDQTPYDLVEQRIVASFVRDDADALLEECLFTPEFETLPSPLPEGYCERIIQQVIRTIETARQERGWLILDTFRSALLVGAEKGAENDSSVINYLVPLRQLAKRYNWAISLLHHSKKNDLTYSGNPAIAGCMDVFWMVERDQDSPIARVSFHTRRGTAKKLNLERDDHGKLNLLCADSPAKKETDLLEFINLWPDTADTAATLSDMLNNHPKFFTNKGWTKQQTVKNKLQEATRAGLYPRLEIHPEDAGKKGVAFRYFRV